MRALIALGSALSLSLPFVGCNDSEAAGSPSSAGTEVLRFTAIPDQNSTELQQKFDPVADYLSKELGVPVEYVPAADYQASVDMFKNGDVHLAWFGGYTGLQARQAVKGARAIAQGAEDPHFKSYFIAHASTGIERSESFPMALEGKSFTFGAPDSTSGRLMPEHFIVANTGKAPAEFFAGQPGFSGSHDKTAELVASGEVQTGVLNYKVYEKNVETGKIDPNVCKIVWVTPEYPDYNLTAHPEIDAMFGAGTIDKLQGALTSMQDPKLLAAFQRSALIPASNEDFEPIAEVARSNEMLR